MIKACALNDENYDVAMNLLKSRYDNIKTIRDAHFDCIFQAQQLSTKSAAGIRRLISNINENVQALKNLKEKTENWDSILVFITKKKLDSETRLEWERHVATITNPTFFRYV